MIDTAHVEAMGRQSSSVKIIFGVLSNPVAGIFSDPLMNFNISPTVTSCRFPQSVMYSKNNKTKASSFVRELLPLGEYSMANSSQRKLGVTLKSVDVASSPRSSLGYD